MGETMENEIRGLKKRKTGSQSWTFGKGYEFGPEARQKFWFEWRSWGSPRDNSEKVLGSLLSKGSDPAPERQDPLHMSFPEETNLLQTEVSIEAI